MNKVLESGGWPNTGSNELWFRARLLTFWSWLDLPEVFSITKISGHLPSASVTTITIFPWMGSAKYERSLYQGIAGYPQRCRGEWVGLFAVSWHPPQFRTPPSMSLSRFGHQMYPRNMPSIWTIPMRPSWSISKTLSFSLVEEASLLTHIRAPWWVMSSLLGWGWARSELLLPAIPTVQPLEHEKVLGLSTTDIWIISTSSGLSTGPVLGEDERDRHSWPAVLCLGTQCGMKRQLQKGTNVVFLQLP